MSRSTISLAGLPLEFTAAQPDRKLNVMSMTIVRITGFMVKGMLMQDEPDVTDHKMIMSREAMKAAVLLGETQLEIREVPVLRPA